MGRNQAVGNERRKGEQVSVSDPSSPNEIDGNWRGSCVCVKARVVGESGMWR